MHTTLLSGIQDVIAVATLLILWGTMWYSIGHDNGYKKRDAEYVNPMFEFEIENETDAENIK